MQEFSDDALGLRDEIRRYAEECIIPSNRELDARAEFPERHWQWLKRKNLLGAMIPEEYGGAGLPYSTYIMVVEELSRAMPALGVGYEIHVSLVTETVFKFGSDQQRRKYVTRLASGEWFGAFALTEKGAGSDAAAQKSRAVLDGDEWVINGDKCFIFNAPRADLYLVMAMTEPEKGARGISAFLVEKGAAGFTFGEQYDKMGIRASVTTELFFDNVRVPAENMLGQQGQGFKIAMAALDSGRIGIAAQAVGIAQAALELSVEWAKTRVQFGKPISDLQAIQWMIAETATRIDAARLLTFRAAHLAEKGVRFTREAAMAKLFASDVAQQATRMAVQIHGGHGFMKDKLVEQLYRDAKITEIYEGTSEIQKLVIASHYLR